MSNLDDLEAAIKRCDRLDWRIDYDEEAEEWCAWFHPDWQVDPQRVVRLVLADDEPSVNEVACMRALQMILADAGKLVQLARVVETYLADVTIPPYTLKKALQDIG